MVERSDQSVNSLAGTTPRHNTPDMLAEAALGLRLDHNTAVGAIAFPRPIAGILGMRGTPAAPFAFGALLAALALIGLAFTPRMAITEKAAQPGEGAPT